jgi:hypothetical protein
VASAYPPAGSSRAFSRRAPERKQSSRLFIKSVHFDSIHEKQKIRRRLYRRDGEFFYPNRCHHLAQKRAAGLALRYRAGSAYR